tara:strand:- start:362 stop:1519 length:1158 start_codon:yes stop_codon:yes gene_type:complete
MKHFILLFTLLFSFNSINAFDPSKLGEDLLKSIPGNVGDQLKKNIPAIEPQEKTVPQKTEQLQKSTPKVVKWNVEEIKKLQCTNEKLNDVGFVSNKQYLEKIDKTVLIKPGNKEYLPSYIYFDSKSKKAYSMAGEGIEINEIIEDLLPITQVNSNPIKTLNFYFKDINKCFSTDLMYTIGPEVVAFFNKNNKYFFIENPLKILKDDDLIYNTSKDPRVFYLYENSEVWLGNFNKVRQWELGDKGYTNLKDFVYKDFKLAKKPDPTITNLYFSYLKVYKLCVVETEFLEKKDFKEYKDVNNKLINITLNKGDRIVKTDLQEKAKDLAWNKANILIKDDEKHQLAVRTMRGAEKSKGSKQCKKMINDTLAVLKTALPTNDKPIERDF